MVSVIVLRAVQHTECPAGEPPVDLLSRPSAEGLLVSLPIVVFGFNAHLQTPIVCAEVLTLCQKARVARRVMTAAIASALALCAALYTAAALAGTLCYGEGVRNDILGSLAHAASSADDRLAGTAATAMAAHLLLAYPVVLYPLLLEAPGMAGTGVRPEADGGAAPPSGATLREPLLGGAGRRRRRSAARSAAVIGFSVAVALLAGARLNVVFSVIGGTVGSALTCWLPAALLAKRTRAAWRQREVTSADMLRRSAVGVLLVLVGVGAFTGTLVTVGLA